MITFLYYSFILAFGISLANIFTKIIDFSLYKYVQYLYKKSLEKQFEAAKAKMLEDAEPGVAIQYSDSYGPGLN